MFLARTVVNGFGMSLGLGDRSEAIYYNQSHLGTSPMPDDALTAGRAADCTPLGMRRWSAGTNHPAS
ncbi:hypothetical protein C476_12106 [Natrinema limicola JCM 13563]|uniref:Uncharacterized protein n=1 Tax=Natrinema limicola JCM 13563 TaxID=1230457 RepID=M0C7F6_9EURY|nr:hypothetical protein C476_12106 [Natrinema limicola JCM 13563]